VLVPILPGVLQLAGAPPSFEARAMAVQLQAGPTGFLSGPTAGVLHGLRNMTRTTIEVTLPEWRQIGLPTWARQVRTSWFDADADIVEHPAGFRVAHPLRMLFGLAGQFNQHRFERAAEDAWHRGLVRPDDAAAYLARVRKSGRGGVIRFERWLEHASNRPRPSQSGFEVDVLAALGRIGLPEPVRQHPLVLPGGELIHLDLAWPAVRLGVEPGHSWWHGGDLQQRKDMARDRACDELGWRVLRFDEDARADLPALARQVAVIHRERSRSLRLV
jgi:hypothetical protein